MWLMCAAVILCQEKPGQEKEKPSGGEKKDAPAVKLCWEAIDLYEDTDFQKKMSADDDIMKTFVKKRPKYEKTVKEEVQKTLSTLGIDLVECPKHKLEGSPLKQVDDKAKPYHFKMLLAYSDGVFSMTLYVKMEIYKDDKLLADFRDERSIGITRVLNRTKRKEAILRFANKIVRTMADKIGELEKKK